MNTTFQNEMQYATSLNQAQASRLLHYVCTDFAEAQAELPDKLNIIHQMLTAYMNAPTTENTSGISRKEFNDVAKIVYGATKLMVELSEIFTLSQNAKR
ncbi:hypothetical protein J2Y45_002143 [Dyadobacter sp. BE34]|uniref:Uncharacterized protein n=1 Tax=Dyadobacter fermentans TaxID=94254 RepID=A0ABU1QWK1_9BACT|nr:MULTISPECIES: hypothetical protein [Dyadobacter]MDR6805548.1 hypothetical protein [Dyadobacter fermentans]MDR7042692.1 hypothetical protein [Dyadobacter sp. BE242]MDR7197004.1 hypothetical protein [Dyadobacter sp. BE34]MDR7215561.1 hypothetical protein [Dyadobacter sp. BE31]MDR7263097.1 hypothetical protein [Dyadobacter sp. BE32]